MKVNINRASYILIFIIFLLIGIFTPTGGDDWSFNIWYRQNFISTILEFFNAWNYFNGRLLNNIFQATFAYYPFLWSIISALLNSLIVYLLAKTFNYEKKFKSIFLFLVLLLSVPISFRTQVQFHLIGNVAYLPITFLSFGYFLLIYKYYKDNIRIFENNILDYFFWGSCGFCLSLWMENFTIALLFITILIIIIELIKKRLLNYRLCLGLIGIIFGSVILFSSPGLSSRFVSGTSISTIISMISNNIFETIRMITLDNLIIWFVMCIVSLFYLFSIKIKNKYYYIMIVMTIITSFVIFLLLCNVKLMFLNTAFLNMFSILMLFNLLLIIFSIQNKEHRLMFLILFIFTSINVGTMVLTPYPRSMIFAHYAFIALTCYLYSLIKIKNKDVKKILNTLLLLFLLIRVENYYIILKRAYEVSTQRIIIINDYKLKNYNEKIDNNNWIVFPKYEENLIIQSLNSDYYYNPILKYYNLSENTNITFDKDFFINGFTEEVIEKNTKKYYFKNISDEKYKYKFKVIRNSVLFEEITTDKPELIYSYLKSGIYSMECDVINQEGKIKSFRNYILNEIN